MIIEETPERSVVLERIDISQLTPEIFNRKYRDKNVPVIITGGLEDIQEWSIDLLRDKLSEGSYPVRCYGSGHFDKPKAEWSKYCELQDMTIDEYADQLTSRHAHNNNHYLAQVAVGDKPLAEVLRNSMERLADNTGMRKITDMGLWLGPNGHTEPLHWDCGDGTVLMLHGAKKVKLFSPRHNTNLYPFPLYKGGAAPWFSQVYVDQPDFEVFPKLEEAIKHKIEFTLSKGEILYIPACWWHELSSAGDDFYTCSINRFWKVSPFRLLFNNKLALSLYLLQMGLMFVAKLFPRKMKAGTT